MVGQSRMEGETEVLIFTSTQGEGTYEVRDPRLTDAEMDELQETLNAQLAVECQTE